MGRVGRPRAAYPGKEGRPRFHPERVASAPWHSSWNGTTPSGLADLRWGRGTRVVRLRRPTLRYETEPLRGIGEDENRADSTEHDYEHEIRMRAGVPALAVALYDGVRRWRRAGHTLR